MAPTPEETAARTRAALAYANIKRTRKGQRLDIAGISFSSMDRIIKGNSEYIANRDEREAIADATGVPRAFMEQG